MSICIATMGKFCRPSSIEGKSTTIVSGGGGGGGGGIQYIEKKKPIVMVTKVKYEKKKRKDINMSVRKRKTSEELYNEYKSR